jgi:hypothetical protein
MHGGSFGQFSAAPSVSLRPSGSDINVQVRYVTRASERSDMRNRLYQRFIELLREKSLPKTEQTQRPAAN